ncbi:hypothetical protein RBB50_005459 [Rhinocladiella similis]
MPSVTFADTVPAKTISLYNRPQKKQKLNITQTYFLAYTARGKLSHEAAQADHNLRLLVGHANMLDSLMLDLANAEQEQERWYSNILNGSPSDDEDVKHEETILVSEKVDEKPENETQITTVDVDCDIEDNEEDLTLIRTVSRHSSTDLSLDYDSSNSDGSQDISDSHPSHEDMMPESFVSLPLKLRRGLDRAN